MILRNDHFLKSMNPIDVERQENDDFQNIYMRGARGVSCCARCSLSGSWPFRARSWLLHALFDVGELAVVRAELAVARAV